MRDNELLRNTVVVYTSDQGMLLGEHDYIDKRWMYEESIRMPLIIHYPPMITGGSRSDWLKDGSASHTLTASTEWLPQGARGNRSGDARRDGSPHTTYGLTGRTRMRNHHRYLLTLAASALLVPFLSVGVAGEIDNRPSKANLEFQIVADDKSLWTSGIMSRDDEANPVDVDLAGVRQVDLIVTVGVDNFACDHADWVDARFELAKKAKS